MLSTENCKCTMTAEEQGVAEGEHGVARREHGRAEGERIGFVFGLISQAGFALQPPLISLT